MPHDTDIGAMVDTDEIGQTIPDKPTSGDPHEVEKYDLETLRFDADGGGETFFGATHPIIGLDARSIEGDASKKTVELFPGSSRHNDRADAFRHAYASFLLTKSQGAWAAKRVGDGDAHEIAVPNPLSERTMDLYNNHVGRALASNPFNWDVTQCKS